MHATRWISMGRLLFKNPSNSPNYHLLLQSLTTSTTTSHNPSTDPRKPITPTTTTHLITLTTIIIFILLFLLLMTISSSLPSPSLTSSSTATMAMVPLPVHSIIAENTTEEEREFWRQPDGKGYEPCIEFGLEYRRESAVLVKERRRFLVAVVNGGLNQQRNQIVDAVVIARILGAALVLPVLKVNAIWGDQSEFSDIFDGDHFKAVLRSDVHVVSSLPPSLMVKRRSTCSTTLDSSIPSNASPHWIRTRFSTNLKKNGVLVLKGLDSKLSKDLPLDLQKLRCKVAFHALRFAGPVRELGEKLARRMWDGGPYIAVHLRLEKDVWVRTGCLPGLGPEFDELVLRERRSHPAFLTSRLNLTHHQRRIAGLCPLNAYEVATVLKMLGAPESAQVYMAGGEPLGGDRALEPLRAEFPNLMSKEMLALPDELAEYANRSSVLAALDFIVAMSSEVFMPSHGGNMGLAMQGLRAYTGHRKYIRPNKRAMVKLLGEGLGLSDEDLRKKMKGVHRRLMGQPEERRQKTGRDVIAYPVPDCMCRRRRQHRFSFFK